MWLSCISLWHNANLEHISCCKVIPFEYSRWQKSDWPVFFEIISFYVLNLPCRSNSSASFIRPFFCFRTASKSRAQTDVGLRDYTMLLTNRTLPRGRKTWSLFLRSLLQQTLTVYWLRLNLSTLLREEWPSRAPNSVRESGPSCMRNNGHSATQTNMWWEWWKWISDAVLHDQNGFLLAAANIAVTWATY